MAERVRLLYVIDSLVPGGAETSLASMAEHFDDVDIDLHVAYFHERPGLHDRFRAAGADLHHIGSGRAARVRELRRLAGDIDADLLHTTLYEADQAGRIAGRLSGRPVISSFVSTGFELADPWTRAGLKGRAAVLVDALTVRAATQLHAVSRPVAEFMAGRLHVSVEDFTIIPRGRDPDELGRPSADRRARMRERLDLGDRPVVLAVGRQVDPKGHLTLVDALPGIVERFPDVAVLLAGQPGGTTAEIDRRVAAHGISSSVEQLGHRSDVADLLAAADVLAHPSLREGFPGTLVEALALECPIVASDLPTIRSVVDGDGEMLAHLVPPSDSTALSDAVVEVLSSGGDAERTRRGRTHFEQRFTTAIVVGEFRRMYDEALGEPRTSTPIASRGQR